MVQFVSRLTVTFLLASPQSGLGFRPSFVQELGAANLASLQEGETGL